MPARPLIPRLWSTDLLHRGQRAGGLTISYPLARGATCLDSPDPTAPAHRLGHPQPKGGCSSPICAVALAVFALLFMLQRIFHNALRVTRTGSVCARTTATGPFSVTVSPLHTCVSTALLFSKERRQGTGPGLLGAVRCVHTQLTVRPMPPVRMGPAQIPQGPWCGIWRQGCIWKILESSVATGTSLGAQRVCALSKTQ